MITQEAAILAHLKTGSQISPLDALQKYGCFCLAEVVYRLRQKGYEIETGEGTSFGHGRTKRFALYKLISSPSVNGQRRFEL